MAKITSKQSATNSGEEVISISIRLRGEDATLFREVKEMLAPLCPDRFPSTEVLLYGLRMARKYGGKESS